MEKWDLQLLIVTAALSPFLVPGNILQINRPFPSCPKPLFQSEAKCQANDMKEMQFLFQASMNGKVGFAAFNSDSGFEPVFSAG